MKTPRNLFLFLIVTVFLASCTPQEALTDKVDNTSQDVFATGDGDDSSHDDDKDG